LIRPTGRTAITTMSWEPLLTLDEPQRQQQKAISFRGSSLASARKSEHRRFNTSDSVDRWLWAGDGCAADRGLGHGLQARHLTTGSMAPRQPRRGLSTQRRNDLLRGRGIAFLASRVGARSSRRWGERLRSVDLDARQAMLFWNVAIAEGQSQRQLADALGLPESRIVGLVDSLETDGHLERRTTPSDRRARRLHLTGGAATSSSV